MDNPLPPSSPSDSAELQHLRQQIRQLEFKNTALNEHAIVSATDAAGNITFVNHKFVEISGYGEAELLGQNHRMLKSGIHSPPFYQDLWDTVVAGNTWHGEVCNRRKNGALYWVRATVILQLDENGLPEGYLSIRTDITELKHTEENARHNQSLLRSVIDAIPDLIYFKDSEGKYVGCNSAFEQYVDTSEALILGKTDFDFVDEATANTLRAMDKRLVASGLSQKREEWLAYPDGRQVFMETTNTPYWYGDKKYGVIGVLHDITNRNRQLRALQESEARWAFAIEGAGDGVWDWNIVTGEMLLSALYEAMLGYDEHELPQTIEAWIKSVHPDDLAAVQATLQDYLAGKIKSYVVELRLQCKDGSYKWVLCRGTVVERDASGNPVRMIGIHSDINERKLAETELLLFRRIFETSEQAIGIADGEGKIRYINPAHESMHRRQQEEVMGESFAIFLTEAAIELAPNIIEATGKGESWVGLLPQKRGDGSEFISYSHINALMGSDGKPQYIFNILYDYTEELSRQTELRNARDKAEFANKAKSDFLSNMSHELRTPMNAILGFTQLMEGDASCTADQQENLQQISKAGWHLLDLINEVLDLARVESGDVKLNIGEVAPGEMVAECLALVSPLLAQRKIRIENRLAMDVPEVRADYMRLKRVLINLLSNGIKYNREAGTLVIEAKQEGDELYLSVRDAGRGMTEDQLLHLFEPFTRFGDTDSVQGTGIGLSICKKLIERMNGKIQVESVVGEGSVFTLVLPLSEAVAEHEPKSAERGGLSLLYIEDDAAQQSLLGKWARDHGWNIVFAHDASSGIDAAMKSRYDAILLDIDLPGGFNGLDVKSVFDEMESLRVVPVIGISNMVAKADIEAALQAGFAAYLTKPVDLAELDRVTQTVIRGSKIEE